MLLHRVPANMDSLSLSVLQLRWNFGPASLFCDEERDESTVPTGAACGRTRLNGQAEAKMNPPPSPSQRPLMQSNTTGTGAVIKYLEACPVEITVPPNNNAVCNSTRLQVHTVHTVPQGRTFLLL
jgi:hypothetical protein